jgi:hypothetical protein
MSRLDFLLSGVCRSERTSGLWEMRALSLVYLGADHPATVALAQSIADPTAMHRARSEIDTLPAIRRRRLLAGGRAVMDA